MTTELKQRLFLARTARWVDNCIKLKRYESAAEVTKKFSAILRVWEKQFQKDQEAANKSDITKKTIK